VTAPACCTGVTKSSSGRGLIRDDGETLNAERNPFSSLLDGSTAS